MKKINFTSLILINFSITSVLSAELDNSVVKLYDTEEKANIFAYLKQTTTKSLEVFPEKYFETRESRLVEVSAFLKDAAMRTQKNVLEFLKDQRFPNIVKSFWIANVIFIEDADYPLVKAIANFEEVSHITLNQIVHIEESQPYIVSKRNAYNTTSWGVEKIQAPEVWALDGGNSGEGIIVGSIDTGVRYTHEALRNNFRGDYGWFDPFQLSPIPVDEIGHGTHVMGTIAGGMGIGVSPGAQWMACRFCESYDCHQLGLLECGQFMACPFLPDGSSEDCTKAAHVVSNSWIVGQGVDFFSQIIESWHRLDIVPVFANGNAGALGCGFANSPADYPLAIAVGSTTIEDTISDFSSLGPSITGLIKPNIVAPGSAIKSAYKNSDTDYRTSSGTSMAAPHVAGVVALIRARNPQLDVPTIKRLISNGSETTGLVRSGHTCGGIDEKVFPNNVFGTGRLNALRSFLASENFFLAPKT